MAHRPLATERVEGNGRAGYKANRPRQRNNNRYSAEDKAKGLVVATLVGNFKASQWLPIPQQTISDWQRGRGITEEIRTLAKHFATELAAKLESIANEIALDMPNKIDRAGLKDQAIALGIVVEKRQLLEGLPTAINESQGLSNEDRAARIAELMERAKARPHND